MRPIHGDATVDGTKIVYTPDGDYNGEDTFEYYVEDGEAHDVGKVTVTITQVNDNPVAVTDNVTTPEDTPKDIFVLSNDTDVDTNSADNEDVLHSRDDFSITSASVNATAHGSVEIVGDKLVYTPDANSFEDDVITYTISDGKGGSATGTVNVTVESVNDDPVFVSTPEDMSLTEDGADGSENFEISDVETAGTDLTVTVTNSTNTGLVRTTDVTVTKGEDGNRTVTVNPRANQNGSADITLLVEDADGGSVEHVLTVTVAAVNDAPTAQSQSTTIDEDTDYTVAWTGLTNDVDIATNGDSLTVTIETGDGASHGNAVVDGNNLVYTPGTDWNGVDSFVYTVTDETGGVGGTNTGTITITVDQVNDAPVADDDTKTTAEDTAADIFVLSNDTDTDQRVGLNADPDAEVLSISLEGAELLRPIHGDATVDGTKIAYTPDGDYNGEDTFEYYVEDGEAHDVGKVTVTITQVNDNPVAVTDSATTKDEEPVSVNVLANDTDVDTNSANNEDVLHSTDTFSVQSCGFVGDAHGTLSESGGTITYTPSLNFTGTQEISYVLSDGHGGSANGTLYVQVNEENDAPVATDDDIETPEDTQVSYNVLDNDSDQDIGDQISFVSFTEDTSSLPGSISATAGGVVTFDPDANYHGSFTIGYTIRDLIGLTDTAEITITVTAVNDAPEAQDDAVQTPEDTPTGINVGALISDADITTDGDTLTVSVANGDGPAHGAAVVSGKTITYTPNADWNGVDHITYTVTDSQGASDKGVITVTVTAVNDSPAANNDTAATKEDKPVYISVLMNDTDVDTDENLNTAPQAALTIDPLTLSDPRHGDVEIAGRRILYTPDPDYNGTDSFTYWATDGTARAKATVQVTIGQVNDNPVANNDTAVTNDEESVTIDVLDNDTDVDTQAGVNGDERHKLADFRITRVGNPTNGTAHISNGKINYTPRDTFAGVETFAYTMSDGHGGTASASVTVTVVSVNDPPDTPVVHTPVEGERYGGSSTLQVTWSGFDIDGDVLAYTLEYYDGSAWHVEKANLTDTAYDFTIPDTLGSITDLQFRVKASDAEFTSGYGYSGHVSVDMDIPVNIVVTMEKADGSAYTEGTWTNQSVIVTAVDIDDWSEVTFSYALEDKDYKEAENKTVTDGRHNVFIRAEDEFGNRNDFGGYLVRIDKQAPAVPDAEVTTAGIGARITLTLRDDPGGSGNRYIIMPDGSREDIADGSVSTVVENNGVYTFTLYDRVGNSTEFTVSVDILDETPPVIRCDSGEYEIGSVSAAEITAALIFTDSETEIVARGYVLSEGNTYSGAYKSYTGDIVIDQGTHYIHAYAKNASGLTAFETFGPFIVNIPNPDTGETGSELGEDPSNELGNELGGELGDRGDVAIGAPDAGGSKIRLPAAIGRIRSCLKT